MRLYIFIQNHVKPAPFEQRGSNNIAIPKLVELDSLPDSPNDDMGLRTAKRNIIEKFLISSAEESNNSVKLFGVPLSGKKRLHPDNNH